MDLLKLTCRQPAPPPDTGEITEEEYWRREWEKHQDDRAVVDVDVRGWIYTPHRGQTSRKQRLFIGVARQLCGIPAPPAPRPGDPSYSSQASSRVPSPHREKQDEELAAQEAAKIVRKGENEQRYARRGAFSEVPVEDRDGDSLYQVPTHDSSRASSPDRDRHRLSQVSVASSIDDDPAVMPFQKRATWPQPANMTSAELEVANNHLLNRLRLFMANPLASSPISCFFYNEFASRQHTVYTNAAGHFSCRAALDFVPTHVRVLAGEKLSATEEVTITSPKGVSLISDIDDTIKHSGIIGGAREIFRNAFIRELDDLTVEGVREWYNTMHDMGTQLHYVSNSPWQIYPVLTRFFKLAHLPPGSFHLKQYSGMLQGIFEPVAERKKSSLEKIIGDFPDRKFILVGDSGEADLEVYTEVALDHPGRVLGVFIRDVTTPVKSGYFDPSNGSMTGSGMQQSRSPSASMNGDSLAQSKRLSRPDDIRNDDADLRAAIAASLADMEDETGRAKKAFDPDSLSSENSATPRPRSGLPPLESSERIATKFPEAASPEEDLIDFGDEPAPDQQWSAPPPRKDTTPRMLQANGGALSKPVPSPPPKPVALRSPSPSSRQPFSRPETSPKPPPPRPRKPSSAVKPPTSAQIEAWTPRPHRPHMPQRLKTTGTQHQPSPLSQMTQVSPEAKAKPPLPVRRGHRDGIIAKGLALPASYWKSDAALGQPRATTPKPASSHSESVRTMSSSSTKSMENLRSSPSAAKAPPPAPPPRLRNVPSYSTTSANRKAMNRLSGGFDDGTSASLPGTPAEAGVSKKEFLWNQRWARAKGILERQGVTLRSWREGSDVADVCVRLAEHALRDMGKR